ncbi:hypothetical protein OIU84_019878 [Salix udensis]|uniref:Uncharacterized protein n=1 Tax=Salix udensis TaxID=889485 RepID=A0AAD6L008_9ROSI|nr:hypothetical protein OIU84_019878 [Salix udensis]
MSASKMSLKLLIDSKLSKVVFAEARKDFVDFLLHLLSLPLGTVMQVLTKSAMTGCIGNLYGSLQKLDESYLQPNQNKDSILNPTTTTPVTNPNFLLPNINRKPEDQKLYCCEDHPGFVSDFQNSVCSQCRYAMDLEMICQCLQCRWCLFVGLLNKFDIKDFCVLEEKVVQFGINEGLELLKASLSSKDALTADFPSKAHSRKRWRGAPGLRKRSMPVGI